MDKDEAAVWIYERLGDRLSFKGERGHWRLDGVLCPAYTIWMREVDDYIDPTFPLNLDDIWDVFGRVRRIIRRRRI
jgi:hypothetical protein